MQILIYITLIFLFASNNVHAQARAQLSNTEINFDTIYYGQGAVDTIFVENVGNQDLIIIDTSWPDGSPIVYYYTRTNIPPGDSGIIVVGINKACGKHGSTSGYIRSRSNSETEIPIIQIKAFIKSGSVIEFNKDKFDFGIVTQGQELWDTVFITNIGNLNLEISDVHTSDGGSSTGQYTNHLKPNETGFIVGGYPYTGSMIGKRLKHLNIQSNALNAQPVFLFPMYIEVKLKDEK